MKKCFSFAVGGLPDPMIHPIRAIRVSRFFKNEIEGLIGMHLYDCHHTFLVFGTLDEAKRARNKFLALGSGAGDNIMECTMSEDGKNMTIMKKAE